MEKRIYLRNNRQITITMTVDTSFQPIPGNPEQTVIDSLDGISIPPGNRIITFGRGTWSEPDEEFVKMVLKSLWVRIEGDEKLFRLPENLTIGHGIFIPELIVKIDELETDE